MNLYDLHPDPESAPGYDTRYDDVPELVWKKYRDQPEELRKREKALAREAKYAYRYAHVLKGPFQAGEAAIATRGEYVFVYARNVLRSPFPAGEAAVAKSCYAYIYAREVLNLPEEEAMRRSRNWNEP
jgi:hypothetical protein